jgi:phosphopantothenoylcysteine decarboxylase/phosphopantothenate--cysteine ligase
MRALEGKKIVLGVTGGIAAYKAADLASKLVQAGAQVYVVMTPSAQEFVSPLTFEALTGQPVTTDIFDQGEFSIQHVALADLADAVVVAPATANNIARIASGLADDMVCLTVLATRAPVVIAPAMDEGMFQAPATQENLKKLKERGLVIVGPAYGRLASGKEGWGRMEEPEKIIGTLRWALGRGGDLAGKKIVVTAGGTQEPLDPVRVLTNKSSGKMGYALAEAARDRGAQVVLVSAPTAIAPPVGVELVSVNTAQEMKEAVEKAVKGAHALLMAAAVADYRPKKYAGQKIKRGQAPVISLELERTPDILGEVKGDFLRVGFALETENLVANARKKLKEKALDLVVANDISAFAQDQSQVVLIDKSGKAQKLPLLPKLEIAHLVLDRVAGLLCLANPARHEGRRHRGCFFQGNEGEPGEIQG